MPIVVKTVTVKAQGVGRVDYSSSIEYAVEPVIRSYENMYKHYQSYPVLAGESLTIDVTIPADTVVLVYDFMLSCPRNVLITLDVDAVDVTGAIAPIFRKSSYLTVIHHIAKGFPVFRIIRVTMTNHGSFDLNLALSIAGIFTSEETYHLAIL